MNFLALLLALTGLAIGHPHDELPVSQSQAERDSLAKAKTLTVSEGLPRPGHATYGNESKRRDVAEIAGFAFYKPVLKPGDEIAGKLRTLLADSANLRAWTGEKRCGGFHPDWSINWKSGWRTNRALICFGCNEILFFTHEHQLRYDLTPGAFETLKALLAPLHSKRPDTDPRLKQP